VWTKISAKAVSDAKKVPAGGGFPSVGGENCTQKYVCPLAVPSRRGRAQRVMALRHWAALISGSWDKPLFRRLNGMD
ncbi:hypothetical protein ACXYUI_29225, partial [Klebsiella pneumoniae]